MVPRRLAPAFAGFAPRCMISPNYTFPLFHSIVLLLPKQNSFFFGFINAFYFYFFKLLNEFYYIYSYTTVITTQFYSISIPNPRHIPPVPNMSHLETISFSKSVSHYLLCKEVHYGLFLDSTCKWEHMMLVSHCLTNLACNFWVHPCC